MELVLESEALYLGLASVLIGGCFDVVLDSVNFLINLMVFFEEAGKVVITDLELVDNLVMLGEFAEEVVFFDGHGF